MIHFVLENVSKLLVYPQITFSGIVRKSVKCDYLTEKKLLDLSLKILS